MQVLHVLASASQRHQPNASDNRTAPFCAVLPLQVQNNRCVCVSCRRRHRCRHRCCSCHALLLHISLCCVFFGVVIATLLLMLDRRPAAPPNHSQHRESPLRAKPPSYSATLVWACGLVAPPIRPALTSLCTADCPGRQPRVSETQCVPIDGLLYPPPPLASLFLRRQTQQLALHRVPWFLPIRCRCKVYSGSCVLWSSCLHAFRQSVPLLALHQRAANSGWRAITGKVGCCWLRLVLVQQKY